MKKKTKITLAEKAMMDLFFRTLDQFLALWKGNQPDVPFDLWLKTQKEEYIKLKTQNKKKGDNS